MMMTHIEVNKQMSYLMRQTSERMSRKDVSRMERYVNVTVRLAS